MRLIFYSIIFFCLVSISLFGQENETRVDHTLKAGVEIPLQYALQYDLRFYEKLSINVQAGILTRPFNDAILTTLEFFGTDENTIQLIENAFQFGTILDVGCNYHFGGNYIGLFSQWIDLKAGDTPFQLIESYFGFEFPPLPIPLPPTLTPKVYLKSDLFQLGFLYGRRFTFKNNPRTEIHIEIAFSKNIYSNSSLSSDHFEVNSLNNLVDSELISIYSKYAYIPTVNFYFTYRLNK